MLVDNTTYQYIQSQLTKRNKPQMTEFYTRLATFPYPAILLRERSDIQIPVVVVNRNIYVLPGIPRLFKLLLASLNFRLKSLSRSKLFRVEITTQQPEVQIADILTQLQKEADQDNMKIGSYPMWDQSNVVITAIGRNESRVNESADIIMAKIYDAQHLKSRL
ncbi:hypothetical protein BDB01DRAFT_795119 [Pilobolus umbonatus]|nr:hypothetical protein BDB01DRAFT_795119 [Pilobolus umbonatus]